MKSSSFVVDANLASCENIRLHVGYVNPEFDIVIEELQISAPAAPTSLPTTSPTTSKSPTRVIESPPPTSNPTALPTLSSATACQSVGKDPTIILAGPTLLERSGSVLCTLTKVKVDSSSGEVISVVPVGRSYDGHDWEPTAGELSTLPWSCYTSGCQVSLPRHGDGENYMLTSYNHSLSQRDQVARLLESGTFGSTSSDIDDWNYSTAMESSAASWVAIQMNMEMTSHRKFWRRRANARVSERVLSSNPLPVVL